MKKVKNKSIKASWEDVIKASVKPPYKNKMTYPKLVYSQRNVILHNGDTLSVDVAKQLHNTILILFSEEGDVNDFNAYGFYVTEQSDGEIDAFIADNYKGKLDKETMEEIYKQVKQQGLPTQNPSLIKI